MSIMPCSNPEPHASHVYLNGDEYIDCPGIEDTSYAEWMASTLDQMTESVEQYLTGMAAQLDITPEQLAERFTLEWEPVTMQIASDLMHPDNVQMRVIQRVHLKRRDKK